MSLSRQQITLLGIFALFFAPLILVMLMRSSWWQYQPANLKNQGYLVTPPLHLALDRVQEIDGKWLILYELDQACEQPCIDHVTALRQIHRASGRDRDHLAIVLLGTGRTDPELWSRLESIYPEFKLVTDAAGTTSVTLAIADTRVADKTGDPSPIHTYVLDPMHNVILAYGANTNPNGIHKDLKRLLKWSDQEKTR